MPRTMHDTSWALVKIEDDITRLGPILVRLVRIVLSARQISVMRSRLA